MFSSTQTLKFKFFFSHYVGLDNKLFKYHVLYLNRLFRFHQPNNKISVITSASSRSFYMMIHQTRLSNCLNIPDESNKMSYVHSDL